MHSNNARDTSPQEAPVLFLNDKELAAISGGTFESTTFTKSSSY